MRYSSALFGKELYMFRADFLSIISSILTSLADSQHN